VYAGAVLTLGPQAPHRAPRPNKKFLVPPQPELSVKSVTDAMTEQMRVFILLSFISIASVIGDLAYETDQNYVAIRVVQTQHRFFSATI
jgi:hypothetical protein